MQSLKSISSLKDYQDKKVKRGFVLVSAYFLTYTIEKDIWVIVFSKVPEQDVDYPDFVVCSVAPISDVLSVLPVTKILGKRSEIKSKEVHGIQRT